MLKNTVGVDNFEYLYLFDFSRLVDIVNRSLGELNHVDHPAFTLFRVVAYPIEEIEFWVDFEASWPASDHLSSQKTVDRNALVSGRVVEDLLAGDLGKPVAVNAQN